MPSYKELTVYPDPKNFTPYGFVVNLTLPTNNEALPWHASRSVSLTPKGYDLPSRSMYDALVYLDQENVRLRKQLPRSTGSVRTSTWLRTIGVAELEALNS